MAKRYLYSNSFSPLLFQVMIMNMYQQVYEKKVHRDSGGTQVGRNVKDVVPFDYILSHLDPEAILRIF